MKTLRARMVVTVVGLTALALVLVNFAGVLVLQRYLIDRLDLEVSRLGALSSGPRVPRPNDHGFPKGVGDSAIFFRYDSAGNMLPGPSNIDAGDGPDLGPLNEVKLDTVFTATNAGTGESFRVKVIATPGGGYAVAAISMERVHSTVNQLTAIGAGVSLIVLLGLGLASYRIVGFGLKPLTRMEQAAASMADGDLTVRVADTDPRTKTGRLGLALNTMLGRVEAAVTARVSSEQRLRQFLADASHELRTPLTSIRGFAELYRRGGTPPGPELDETMSRIEDEAARMGLLVEDLLLLAALDEERPLHMSKVDLLAVAADTVRDAHVRSPLRNVQLADFEPVTVFGDEHRLRQVTTNLVTNALQHTPVTASITLRVKTIPHAAVLEVSDTGPGVPPEHAPHIFERLYRADPGRTRGQGGAGLGLAIASSIIKAHGGRLELANSPGAGATFRVLLPL